MLLQLHCYVPRSEEFSAQGAELMERKALKVNEITDFYHLFLSCGQEARYFKPWSYWKESTLKITLQISF